MIYIQGPSGPFFFAIFMEIHINIESKYTEERRINKYGLDSKKSKEETMVEEVIVKPLSAVDAQEIVRMDDMSGFYVSQWLEEMDEDNDYSWGIYVNHVLAGYCTIGYADDVPSVIEKHPNYSSESYLLSDVFIKPEYRHNGYGLKMITETILGRWKVEETNLVFLEIIYDNLKNFYGKAGFELLSDGVCMVFLPKNIKGGKL